MKKNISQFLALLSALTCPINGMAASTAAYDPTADLLSGFGDRCPLSYGSGNRQAMADSNSIANIIQTMKDDPACGGIRTALNGVQIATTQAAINAPKSNELALQQQQQICQSVQSALNDPTIKAALANVNDPQNSYAVELQNQLQSCQTQIFTSNGAVAAADVNARQIAATNLQNSMTTLFGSLNQSGAAQCNEASPGVVAKIASQIMGSTSSLVSGTNPYGAIIATGMLTASVLVDQLINFIHNYSMNHALIKLSRANQLTGVDCAIEAVSDSYCKADESLTAINADKAISKESCLSEATVLGNNMDILNGLVISLKNSGGHTIAAINNQMQVNDARSQIEAARLALQEIKVSYLEKTEAERPGFLRSKIDEISQNIMKIPGRDVYIPDLGTNASDWGNVLYYIYSQGTQNQVDQKSLTPSYDSAAFVKDKYPKPPTLDQIDDTVSHLLTEMSGQQNAKSASVGKDSGKLISDMVSGGPISPAEYLGEVQTYIKNLTDYYNGLLKNSAALKPSDKLFYNTELNRLKTLQTPIDDSISTLYSTSSDEEKVSKILSDLTPNSDTQFISVTLQDIIGKDIQKRIQNHTLDASVEDLVKYSASKSMTDVTGALSQLQSTNLASKTQLDDAKLHSQTNLQSLGDVYGKLMSTQLGDMQKNIDKNIDPETQKSNIAKSCILMAQIPSPPSLPSCAGAKWKDPDTGETLNYDDIMKKAWTDRVCTVHQFYKKAVYRKETRGSSIAK